VPGTGLPGSRAATHPTSLIDSGRGGHFLVSDSSVLLSNNHPLLALAGRNGLHRGLTLEERLKLHADGSSKPLLYENAAMHTICSLGLELGDYFIYQWYL